jgi:hypothetical protein
MDSVGETRRRSAALFGNEKTVETVLALADEGAATAQMVAARTGIPYSLVRDALVRLSAGRAVREIPRVGGSRSPLYYQPVEGDLWDALTAAARAVAGASTGATDQQRGPSGDDAARSQRPRRLPKRTAGNSAPTPCGRSRSRRHWRGCHSLGGFPAGGLAAAVNRCSPFRSGGRGGLEVPRESCPSSEVRIDTATN